MSQMSQMSQMSLSLSLSLSGLKGRSLYVKSKSTVTKSSHMSRMSRMSQMCQMSQMSQTCLLITLIKCLKGHKSLGSLCSVVKTLIVSLVRQTDQASKQGTMSPIELFWIAKNGHSPPKEEKQYHHVYNVHTTHCVGIKFSR